MTSMMMLDITIEVRENKALPLKGRTQAIPYWGTEPGGKIYNSTLTSRKPLLLLYLEIFDIFNIDIKHADFPQYFWLL